MWLGVQDDVFGPELRADPVTHGQGAQVTELRSQPIEKGARVAVDPRIGCVLRLDHRACHRLRPRRVNVCVVI
jgi:hypothetical protein